MTAVLFIDMSTSRCGTCQIECNPYEETHDTNLGYDDAKRSQPGCGVEYTHVSSNYAGAGIEAAAMGMRPDLPFVDFFEAQRLIQEEQES